MPGSQAQCSIMEEASRVRAVLNRFVRIPEQTYRDFLGTFTRPPTGKIPIQKSLIKMKKERHKIVKCAPSGPNIPFLIHKATNLLLSHSQQDIGVNVFHGFVLLKSRILKRPHGDVHRWSKRSQYFDLSDLVSLFTWHKIHKSAKFHPRAYERELRRAETEPPFVDLSRSIWCKCAHSTPELLPGEAEAKMASYLPSFTRCTHLPFQTLPPTQQPPALEGEEVRPFSLDDGFDYDRVALTPKFSEGEMKFIERPEKSEANQ
ncbi:intraflagellar transport-associated protein [Ascaphus truei]|uniref:intraflagellar transport-associated protein n=1 Tax=Ascaphus truei TaxID=8439 RepID=UPI003F5A9541